jgi:histone H4
MAKGKGKRSGAKAGGKKAGGISKGGIRRLARRAGVKRIGAPVYDEVRAMLKEFVGSVMTDTVSVMELTKKKTVSASDVLYALKKAGKTLYAVA